MTTLSVRSYADEADLPAMVDLINACEAADRLGDGTSLDEQRQDLSDPKLEGGQNVALWHDADGALVAEAKLYIYHLEAELQGRLFLHVHPAAREGELGAQVITWATAHLHALAGGAQPIRLEAKVREHDQWRSALLASQGLAIVRYSLTMTRPLDQPIPDTPLPAGFTLHTVDGERDAAAWVEMYNQSFIDHWNFRPWGLENFAHWWEDPNNDPQLCLVARAADGTFAGFCWGLIAAEDNARSGRNMGEIDLLGTRRGFRRAGLGRALLLEGLRRLKSAGADTARLHVDAESPTGATRLYEATGFSTVERWVSYVRIEAY